MTLQQKQIKKKESKKSFFIFKIKNPYSGGMIIISANSQFEAIEKLKNIEDYQGEIKVESKDGEIIFDPTDEDNCVYPYYSFILEKITDDIDVEYDFYTE